MGSGKRRGAERDPISSKFYFILFKESSLSFIYTQKCFILRFVAGGRTFLSIQPSELYFYFAAIEWYGGEPANERRKGMRRIRLGLESIGSILISIGV